VSFKNGENSNVLRRKDGKSQYGCKVHGKAASILPSTVRAVNADEPEF
jgi:hypothetical protein